MYGITIEVIFFHIEFCIEKSNIIKKVKVKKYKRICILHISHKPYTLAVELQISLNTSVFHILLTNKFDATI